MQYHKAPNSSDLQHTKPAVFLDSELAVLQVVLMHSCVWKFCGFFGERQEEKYTIYLFQQTKPVSKMLRDLMCLNNPSKNKLVYRIWVRTDEGRYKVQIK